MNKQLLSPPQEPLSNSKSPGKNNVIRSEMYLQFQLIEQGGTKVLDPSTISEESNSLGSPKCGSHVQAEHRRSPTVLSRKELPLLHSPEKQDEQKSPEEAEEPLEGSGDSHHMRMSAPQSPEKNTLNIADDHEDRSSPRSVASLADDEEIGKQESQNSTNDDNATSSTSPKKMFGPETLQRSLSRSEFHTSDLCPPVEEVDDDFQKRLSSLRSFGTATASPSSSSTMSSSRSSKKNKNQDLSVSEHAPRRSPFSFGKNRTTTNNELSVSEHTPKRHSLGDGSSSHSPNSGGGGNMFQKTRQAFGKVTSTVTSKLNGAARLSKAVTKNKQQPQMELVESCSSIAGFVMESSSKDGDTEDLTEDKSLSSSLTNSITMSQHVEQDQIEDEVPPMEEFGNRSLHTFLLFDIKEGTCEQSTVCSAEVSKTNSASPSKTARKTVVLKKKLDAPSIVDQQQPVVASSPSIADESKEHKKKLDAPIIADLEGKACSPNSQLLEQHKNKKTSTTRESFKRSSSCMQFKKQDLLSPSAASSSDEEIKTTKPKSSSDLGSNRESSRPARRRFSKSSSSRRLTNSNSNNKSSASRSTRRDAFERSNSCIQFTKQDPPPNEDDSHKKPKASVDLSVDRGSSSRPVRHRSSKSGRKELSVSEHLPRRWLSASSSSIKAVANNGASSHQQKPAQQRQSARSSPSNRGRDELSKSEHSPHRASRNSVKSKDDRIMSKATTASPGTFDFDIENMSIDLEQILDMDALLSPRSSNNARKGGGNVMLKKTREAFSKVRTKLNGKSKKAQLEFLTSCSSSAFLLDSYQDKFDRENKEKNIKQIGLQNAALSSSNEGKSPAHRPIKRRGSCGDLPPQTPDSNHYLWSKDGDLIRPKMMLKKTMQAIGNKVNPMKLNAGKSKKQSQLELLASVASINFALDAYDPNDLIQDQEQCWQNSIPHEIDVQDDEDDMIIELSGLPGKVQTPLFRRSRSLTQLESRPKSPRERRRRRTSIDDRDTQTPQRHSRRQSSEGRNKPRTRSKSPRDSTRSSSRPSHQRSKSQKDLTSPRSSRVTRLFSGAATPTTPQTPTRRMAPRRSPTTSTRGRSNSMTSGQANRPDKALKTLAAGLTTQSACMSESMRELIDDKTGNSKANESKDSTSEAPSAEISDVVSPEKKPTSFRDLYSKQSPRASRRGSVSKRLRNTGRRHSVGAPRRASLAAPAEPQAPASRGLQKTGGQRQLAKSTPRSGSDRSVNSGNLQSPPPGARSSQLSKSRDWAVLLKQVRRDQIPGEADEVELHVQRVQARRRGSESVKTPQRRSSSIKDVDALEDAKATGDRALEMMTWSK